VTYTDAVELPAVLPSAGDAADRQYSTTTRSWATSALRRPTSSESGAELETLPVWLKAPGYSTGFVGKYLNCYGTDNPEQRSTGMRYVPRAGKWCLGRQGVRYYCATLSRTASSAAIAASTRHLYSKISEDFIGEYAGSGEPFFLWTSHLAPHVGVTPVGDDYCSAGPGLPTPAAERHERMFTGMPLPKSPAVNEADMSDKGTYMRDRKELDLERIAEVHQGRLQALQSLDESVAGTIAALEEQGVLDETLVIFASDNGWLLGEHRAEKDLP
jgi:arylsulfatase A-like enzyme